MMNDAHQSNSAEELQMLNHITVTFQMQSSQITVMSFDFTLACMHGFQCLALCPSVQSCGSMCCAVLAIASWLALAALGA